MDKYIGPSHAYEWALSSMDTFPLDDQQRILERFKNLTWIPDMIQELQPWQRWLLKETIKMNIDNEDVPFCLMSVSCFSYNLRLSDLFSCVTHDKKRKSVFSHLVHPVCLPILRMSIRGISKIADPKFI